MTTQLTTTTPVVHDRGRSRSRRALVVILVVYAIGALVIDTRAHLLTDVGGKTASMAAMIEGSDWDPDIGYWFEQRDPDGRFHPIAKSRRTTDGAWINSTSFTMLLPARPLWAAGGARAALLIPLLGSLATAIAAGSLARRLDPDHDPADAMLVVGLASPMLLYALDFWEHSWGTALMTAGAVSTLDALQGRRFAHVGAAAAFGLAATMRQEALVYGFVATATLTVSLLADRRIRAALGIMGSMAGATLVPLVVHGLVATALVGDADRATRSVSTLGRAGSGVGERLLAAAKMTTAAFGAITPTTVLVSAIVCAGLGTAAALTGRRRAIQVVVVAWLVWTATVANRGMDFVPGLLPAMPLAAFGLASATDRMLRPALWLALAPVPLVMATAFTDGLLVQWGSRYLLTSGVLLTVLGLVWLRRGDPVLRRTMIGVAAGVTVLGLAWAMGRARTAGEEIGRFAQATDPTTVVVWRNAQVSREFGELSIGRRWLSAPFAEDRVELASLLRAEGVNEFLWIAPLSHLDQEFPGFAVADADLPGVPSRDGFVVRFTRATP